MNGYRPSTDYEALAHTEVLGLGPNSHLIAFGLPFLFGLLTLFAVVKFLHKRPVRSILTGAAKFRWSRVAIGLGVWGAMNVALVLAFPEGLEWHYQPERFWPLVVFALITLPFQTLAEEAFFRGYLVQAVVRVTRLPIVGLVLTAAVFALMHFANITDPEDFGRMMTLFALLAGFFAIVLVLDDGLELAWGIHLAQNLLASLVISTDASVLGTDTLFRAVADDPTESVFGFVVIAGVAIGIFWLLCGFSAKNLRAVFRPIPRD